MSNVRNIDQSKLSRVTELLFVLWGLTLPFAAKIGHFSLGFLTIYPNFVLGLLLMPLVFLSFPRWHRYAKAYFGFLVLWIFYAALQPKIVGSAYHDNWKFDMRSLFMQCLFAGVLIGSFYALGRELFLKRLRQLSLYLLLVVLASGLLEFYFGYHLRGHFTDKLFDQYTVTNIFYTPLFIYDNANDYMVYLMCFSMLYFALNYREKESSIWQVITLMTVCFLFAFNANSRIAMWLILGVLLVAFIKGFWHTLLESWKIWIWPALCAMGLVVVLLSSNPLFVGPKYTKVNYTSAGELKRLPLSLPSEAMSSDNIRVALLQNGVEFIKEQPFLGVGPGEFRQRHASGQVRNDAWTVVGPHNFPLELVSQYGIMGWLCGLIWFSLLLLLYRQFKRQAINIWMLLLLPVLAGCSLLPSGFLYLDIHWLIVPVVLIFTLKEPQPSAEINE